MSTLPLQATLAATISQTAGSLLTGLFMTKADKEQMVATYPAARRLQQQLWMMHNNMVEANVVSDAAAAEVIRARGLLQANDSRIAQLDTELRTSAEKAIAQGKLTPADWQSSGLGLAPLLIAAVALVAILPLGWYALRRMTADTQAEAQAILLRAEAQIRAADQGRPIPTFPGDAAKTKNSAVASAGFAAAAVALLALFFIGRGGKR